ncbi:hypothetical protein AAGS40_30510 (plasmid) [Paraburkholderia sp. PREW-6R]|uniref:hypothetical protein n=1 Tax=Paraburkholderia sp. PREW-6R TaxID=3141544 RepID=UPI0031F5C1E8
MSIDEAFHSASCSGMPPSNASSLSRTLKHIFRFSPVRDARILRTFPDGDTRIRAKSGRKALANPKLRQAGAQTL